VGQSNDGSKTTLTAIKKDTGSITEDIKTVRNVIVLAVLIAVAASVIANLLLRQFQDNSMISRISNNAVADQDPKVGVK
jgi:hypothetical protein